VIEGPQLALHGNFAREDDTWSESLDVEEPVLDFFVEALGW